MALPATQPRRRQPTRLRHQPWNTETLRDLRPGSHSDLVRDRPRARVRSGSLPHGVSSTRLSDAGRRRICGILALPADERPTLTLDKESNHTYAANAIKNERTRPGWDDLPQTGWHSCAATSARSARLRVSSFL